ncbi:hypothetical protein HDU79_010688 [Rhizoclosmatium sp. JEL0117]|nr:hypothetical protein HDU79_010688 [Rhizoclosmatium sp. JEL0117]
MLGIVAIEALGVVLQGAQIFVKAIASAEEAGMKHCSKLMTAIETLTKWTIKSTIVNHVAHMEALQSTHYATMQAKIRNHNASVSASGITILDLYEALEAKDA